MNGWFVSVPVAAEKAVFGSFFIDVFTAAPDTFFFTTLRAGGAGRGGGLSSFGVMTRGGLARRSAARAARSLAAWFRVGRAGVLLAAPGRVSAAVPFDAAVVSFIARASVVEAALLVAAVFVDVLFFTEVFLASGVRATPFEGVVRFAGAFVVVFAASRDGARPVAFPAAPRVFVDAADFPIVPLPAVPLTVVFPFGVVAVFFVAAFFVAAFFVAAFFVTAFFVTAFVVVAFFVAAFFVGAAFLAGVVFFAAAAFFAGVVFFDAAPFFAPFADDAATAFLPGVTLFVPRPAVAPLARVVFPFVGAAARFAAPRVVAGRSEARAPFARDGEDADRPFVVDDAPRVVRVLFFDVAPFFADAMTFLRRVDGPRTLRVRGMEPPTIIYALW